MENTLRFPFTAKKGMSSEQNSTLLQIIVVISSGILSSSAIATALKAWLENRKTRLIIHIDDEGKTLTYEGYHLNQDAPTIHILVEKLSQHSDVVMPVDVVIPPPRNDGQKERDALESGGHYDSEQAVPRQQLSLLKRFLPV